MMSPPSPRRGGASRALAIFSRAIAVYLFLSRLGAAPLVAQSQTSTSTPPGTRHRLQLTKFYDDSKPLPAGKAGELIRSEPADEYYLAADFTAVRILYHSRSATGQDVASSGVVLIPDRAPPSGGWPLVAWAHGFSGAARHCAPSLLTNLYYGPFFAMYLNLGYAVVATDYTGLGTDFRSATMDVQSDANDVINSIPAARAAVPQLGSRWVAMGYSHGANVAISVAELEGGIRDPNYLGSIAISGVDDLKDAYERIANEKSSWMLEFVAHTIKTVYPEFNINDMLTDKAIPRYRQVDETCGSVGDGAPLSASQMLKQNWKNNEFVDKFFSRNLLGQKPAYGPILVITGAGDSEGLPPLTGQTVNRMCKQGDRVQLNKFSEPQPGLVLGDSVRDQMAWIEARFAGRPAASNCPGS